MGRKMMVWMVALVMALSLSGLAAAQQQKAPELPQAVKDMVAKAKTGLKTASTDEVKGLTQKKGSTILLDVRSSGEFAAGHLPNAIHVDRGLLEFTVWKAISDQNADIVVYCKTGARATLATRTLQDLGFKNARWSEIHFEPWVKAGNPVAR